MKKISGILSFDEDEITFLQISMFACARSGPIENFNFQLNEKFPKNLSGIGFYNKSFSGQWNN